MATLRVRNGKYEVRWYDGNGRQHSKAGFPTKQQARNYGRAMEGAKVAGHEIDPRRARTRLREIAVAWYATNPGRKEQTRHAYKGLMENHVIPALGDQPVGKVTRATIRRFVSGLTEKGCAPGTVRNVFRNVLKPILDYAVESGCILTNPAIGVKLPPSPRAEMLFLTAEQVARLSTAIGAPYNLMVLLAAYTGLRAGEIGALRVKHLDLMRARVTVAESVSPVKGKGLVYGPTKTYAIRTVTLPRFLIDPLMTYVAHRAGNPDAFVFVTKTGTAIRHGNFMANHFRPAVKRAFAEDEPNLLRLRFHDLRHTAAALLINPPIGANPKVIQERMGHSSIQVTFDRYGHLFPGLDEDLGPALDQLHRSAAR